MAWSEADFGAISRRSALTLALGAATATMARAVPASAGAWNGVDEAANRGIAERKAPGLQISVMRDGALVYSKGFGLANLEIRVPVFPTSVFRVGSLVKQFTGAAILLLAEDGRLSLDDRLARFLPDFPRAGEITLRQMLNHTSGLGNYTETPSPRGFLQDSRPDYDDAALIAAMQAISPLYAFEPGTGWAYSNTAYILLGLVIARASGRSYAQFLRERLFAPHGLARTAIDDAAEIVPGRVSGYTPDPDAGSGFGNASFISMTYAGAAGALRSTTDDLCRWHDLLLLRGRILRPASLEAMTTPARLANGELPSVAGASADAPRIPLLYGMGLGVGRTRDGRRLLAHTGGIQGFSALLRTYVAEKVTIAMAVNSDDGENARAVAAWLGTVREAAEAAAFAA